MTKGAADGHIGLQHDLDISDDLLLSEHILICLGLLNHVVPRLIGWLHQPSLQGALVHSLMSLKLRHTFSMQRD